MHRRFGRSSYSCTSPKGTLAAALVGLALLLSPVPARAVFECGGVQDTCNCGANNFCICCTDAPHGVDHGNCVWYAWHKACCNWGVALQWCTNANTWDTHATSNGYTVLTEPCEETIFVCEAFTSHCCSSSSVGHVGWVNAVFADGSIDVEEQGCYSWYGVQTRHIPAQNASPTMHYIYAPGVTSCQQCECSPGATESHDCGDCGTETRTCGGDCHWGSWGSCTGQGVCSPGQTQQQSCGVCSSQSRTCGSDCQWGSWGSCTNQGVCTPGQTQQQGCGDCGTETRTCDGDCHWGSWGSCTGQGVCSPGQTQQQGCGDCGTETRTCGGDCHWGTWESCTGPDPDDGNVVCETGEPGLCQVGRLRCVEGYLECASVYSPIDELCDEIDNDCNGLVDEGDPVVMGDPPPRFSASLRDCSYPMSLAPGHQAEVWGEFENTGTEAWPRGEIWLGSQEAAGGRASRLYVEGAWPAWDVVAVLDHDVAPGEKCLVRFIIGAPEVVGEEVVESFRLIAPDGSMMSCPSPVIEVAIRVKKQPAVSDDGGPGSSETPDSVQGGCQCNTDGGVRATDSLVWLLMAFMIIVLTRRKTRQ